ncbi:MAG: hypothetical protein JNM72_15790 [Deltaproteobacteria bacterium]|nr:hypothetical protein [Deltaproteobacteria bacterium]
MSAPPPAPPSDPLPLRPPGAPPADEAPVSLSAEDLLPAVLEGAVARRADELSGSSLDGLIVAYGAGPDHIAGERLLAWVPDALPAEAPGALLTTTRCLVQTPQRLLNLRYELVESAAVDVSLQGPQATVRRRGATVQWAATASAPVCVALLRGLCKVPPLRRLDLSPLPTLADDADEPAPVGPPSAGELEATRAQMRCMDERLDLLLRLLERAAHRGLLKPADARVALAGVALLERSLFGGRGHRQGEWLTSLVPLELASVLVGVLGDGVATMDHQGVVRIRWVRAPERGKIPLELWLQWQRLAERLGPRLGWPPPVGPLTIDAQLSPAPWGSSLALLGARGAAPARPLQLVAPDQLALIFAWLRDLEPEHLLQRVLLGADAGTLDPARRGQLSAIAEGWLGGARLAPFFSPTPAAPAHDHGNPAARLPARMPLPLPARLPPVVAANIPALRQRAAALQIAAGLVNLVWVGVARGLLGGLVSGEGLVSQLLASVAMLPLALYALAIIEIGAGVIVLHQRGMRPGPTWEVALLQVLSLPLGGLPSFLAGLGVRQLIRQTRGAEPARPAPTDPRADFHPEDFDPAEETWAFTAAQGPGGTASPRPAPPDPAPPTPPVEPDPSGERTETAPLPPRR